LFCFVSIAAFNLLAHEIWSTLCADGSKSPFFVQTKEAKVAAMNIFSGRQDCHMSYVPIIKHPTTKKNMRPGVSRLTLLQSPSDSRGERGMMAYLEHMTNVAGYLRQGDFLLFDGEKSFNTPLVKSWLEAHGIHSFVLEPSVLHQFINPCDNNYHSLFKLAYYPFWAFEKGNFYSQ
jgi:hypothetical protein